MESNEKIAALIKAAREVCAEYEETERLPYGAYSDLKLALAAAEAQQNIGGGEQEVMGERANLVSAAGDAGNNQETGKRQAQHSHGNMGFPTQPPAQQAEGVDDLAAAIHYPDCWDTAAYPTFLDALKEIGCNPCDCVKLPHIAKGE